MFEISLHFISESTVERNRLRKCIADCTSLRGHCDDLIVAGIEYQHKGRVVRLALPQLSVGPWRGTTRLEVG